AERNPGMVPLLTGDALAGETERLRRRMAQFYERLETQLRQVLRESEARERLTPGTEPPVITGPLVALVAGRLRRFVRSDFVDRPTERWPAQWALVVPALLAAPPQHLAVPSTP